MKKRLNTLWSWYGLFLLALISGLYLIGYQPFIDLLAALWQKMQGFDVATKAQA